MAQASVDKRFFGTITRCHDENEHPVVYGKITTNNGFICALAAENDELGWKLNEMVRMVLGYQYIAYFRKDKSYKKI